MKLISPNGATVSVSNDKGERLLKQGYRRVEAPKPPPPAPRRRKATTRSG